MSATNPVQVDRVRLESPLDNASSISANAWSQALWSSVRNARTPGIGLLHLVVQ